MLFSLPPIAAPERDLSVPTRHSERLALATTSNVALSAASASVVRSTHVLVLAS